MCCIAVFGRRYVFARAGCAICLAAARLFATQSSGIGSDGILNMTGSLCRFLWRRSFRLCSVGRAGRKTSLRRALRLGSQQDSRRHNQRTTDKRPQNQRERSLGNVNMSRIRDNSTGKRARQIDAGLGLAGAWRWNSRGNIHRLVLGIVVRLLCFPSNRHRRSERRRLFFHAKKGLLRFFHRWSRLWFLGQHRGHQLRNLGTERRNRIDERRRLIHQVHRNQIAHRRTQKRRISGQHLVEQNAQGIDIGAVGGKLGASTLLRRHVCGSPHEHVALGAQRLDAKPFCHLGNP